MSSKTKSGNAHDRGDKVSLKRRKGAPRVTIKNYVTSPFSIRWPDPRPEEGPALDLILRQSKTMFSPLTTELKRKRRTQICLGLNDTAKRMERKELSLVLLVRNMTPSVVTEHFPVLSHVTGTPICPVRISSQALGACFGVRRAVAVGFIRKNVEVDPELQPVVDELMKYGKVFRLPWIPVSESERDGKEEMDLEVSSSTHDEASKSKPIAYFPAVLLQRRVTRKGK